MVRSQWCDLRIKLNPSELRNPLKKARLITEGEFHELDPVIGLGRASLNDRLLTYLSSTGRMGFDVFVQVLKQFGTQYQEVLTSLGHGPTPTPATNIAESGMSKL